MVFGSFFGTESFSLDIPDNTTLWIISIWSIIWEEVDGTFSLTTKFQNVYIFWGYIFWKWCINQLSLLNPSSFLFPQVFFSYQLHHYLTSTYQLINFIFIHHLHHTQFLFLSNLESSENFQLFPRFDAVNTSDPV